MPSHEPTLLDTPENSQAVREAFEATADLRAQSVTGFVLVEIDVREDGTVQNVKAILPPPTDYDVMAYGLDAATGEPMGSVPPHTLHPALCQAAERAALKYQFAPAVRDGFPVPYDGYRIGFSFEAPRDGSNIAELQRRVPLAITGRASDRQGNLPTN